MKKLLKTLAFCMATTLVISVCVIPVSAATSKNSGTLATPFGTLEGSVEIISSSSLMGRAGANTFISTNNNVSTATTLNVVNTTTGLSYGSFSSSSSTYHDSIFEHNMGFGEWDKVTANSTHRVISTSTYSLSLTVRQT